ncbi:MAG: ankyrin repeat domain-containing protein [Rickettsia endosymbiont of Sceptobius lativentris]|nr:ankyrin repeat domain-containing protein [Rickettsia endosymbiont of Sceptobius lativentris]
MINQPTNSANYKLPNGSTVLHNAVRIGKSINNIKLLVNQDADITALDADGKKPIDYTSNPEIIEILTQANEDLNCKVQHFFDKYKKFTDITIMERTLGNENLPKHITDKVVEKIIDNWSEQLFKKYKDTDIEILPFVLFEENITDSSIIEKLTQKIKNYNENGDNPVTTPVVDAQVVTPITTATTTTTTTAENDLRAPIPEIVDTIIIHPEDNRTPLGIAASTENADIVKELIEQGANVNEQDEYGNTALFYATTQEIAQILVDKGADFNLDIA